MLSMVCSACCSMLSPTSPPWTGLIGPVPLTKTKSPAPPSLGISSSRHGRTIQSDRVRYPLGYLPHHLGSVQKRAYGTLTS